MSSLGTAHCKQEAKIQSWYLAIKDLSKLPKMSLKVETFVKTCCVIQNSYPGKDCTFLMSQLRLQVLNHIAVLVIKAIAENLGTQREQERVTELITKGILEIGLQLSNSFRESISMLVYTDCSLDHKEGSSHSEVSGCPSTRNLKKKLTLETVASSLELPCSSSLPGDSQSFFILA